MRKLIGLVPASFRSSHRDRWRQITLPIRTSSAKIRRVLWRPAFPRNEGEKLYLHLGCGMVEHKRFVNVDALPARHIHFIRPIDDLSPFKSDSVDLIYASHCLEHFSHLKIPSVLAEWFRVLKKNGILRLSVPDFDLLLRIYCDSGRQLDSILSVLMGAQDYKYNFHMTAFNKSNLEKLLLETGFRSTQAWQPGSTELTTFKDFSCYELQSNGNSYPISLNLEGVK